MKHINRKDFLKKTGVAATGALVLPHLSFAKSINLNATVSVGVIGTGIRGQELTKLINTIDQMQVIACCDVLDFRLKKGVEAVEGKKPKAYSDYRKLLENKDVDAVIITAPLHLHSEIAIAAIDAGKHVYCEKTMAKGIEGTQNLVKAVRNSNTTFQVGHQYHQSRMYVALKQMIDEGKIGKLVSLESQWNRNGNWRRPIPSPEFERQINWRMYRDYSYGLLAELSSHHIDFTNWALEDHPEKVVGMGGIDYWKDGRETYDNIHLTYGYKSGFKASFTCLTANAYEGYRIIIKGDQGSLIAYMTEAFFYPEGKEEEKITGTVDGYSGATIGWTKNKGIPLNLDNTDPTIHSLRDFRNNIWDHKLPLSNIHSGAQTAYAVEMGIQAMDSGNTIFWDDNTMIY